MNDKVNQIAIINPIEKTIFDWIATAKGVAISENVDIVESLFSVLQKVRTHTWGQAWAEEFKKYREKGRIKPDFISSSQGKASLHELLEFISKDCSNDDRFNALKAIFLTIAEEKVSDRSDPIPLEIIKTCKKLDTADILVMLAAYKIYKTKNFDAQKESGSANWVARVAKESGLKHGELVEQCEDKLVALKLIGERLHSDHSGMRNTGSFRLSSLGIALCEYIDYYESNKEA